MALIPMLFQDFWTDADLNRSSRLIDRHFDSNEFLTPLTVLRNPNYMRPWRRLPVQQDIGPAVSINDDKFEAILDVQQFTPNEITIKTIDDKTIVVEGKHEEKQDEHGYVSRHFVRRYVLPEGHDAKAIVSSLSSDGVLTISAPKLATGSSNTRTVPIIQTGPARSQSRF